MSRHTHPSPGIDVPRRLGIDLGTTNTVAAIEGIPVPLAGESGRTTLPSAVSFLANGEMRTGTAAKRRRSLDPKNTLYSTKRILGRPFDHGETQAFQRRYQFELEPAGDGSACFVTRAGPISPTDVASIVLSNMLAQLTHDVSDIDGVVIAVPPGFSEAQRSATLEAAEKAGLCDVRLIEEPLAAAHAYTHVSNPVQRAGVYDLGGGTFDFSVVEWDAGRPRLVASETDMSVGGDDVDQLLADWVTRKVLARHNWDLRSYSEVAMRLLAECERAKIRLCFFEETVLNLDEVDPDCPVPFEGFRVHRDELHPHAETIARQTFRACDSALSRAGVQPDQLDAVFLVGGSTHLAAVRECIETYFGMPGRYDLEPTDAVAIGASLAGPPGRS